MYRTEFFRLKNTVVIKDLEADSHQYQASYYFSTASHVVGFPCGPPHIKPDGGTSGSNQTDHNRGGQNVYIEH